MAATIPNNPPNEASGVIGGLPQAPSSDNPYDVLLTACADDPAQIQAHYDTHRTARNAQQRAKLLDPAFGGLLLDPILQRLEDPGLEPGFADDRHGLVFWARPPEHVLQLARCIQEQLLAAAPHLWLMPLHRMHMTTFEIAHSRTPVEAGALVDALRAPAPNYPEESTLAVIVNHPYRHRARLVKPRVSYDLSAVALSFLPAAGETHSSPPPVPPGLAAVSATPDDAYTYHHLRRDLLAHATVAGVDVAARYVLPSAHMTLGRFLTEADHATPAARAAWVAVLDRINASLEVDVWPAVWDDAARVAAPPARRLVGEWVIGQERGLDARTGAVWYGGGRSVLAGEGF